ncbi:MAG: hypothetical protein GXP31_03130 [Kiritimatiellaeota bacterium]|nr:hypothetical protein [Kiritimatiellota bacterium]
MTTVSIKRLVAGVFTLFFLAVRVPAGTRSSRLSPTHRETSMLGASAETRCSGLDTFWAAADGRILLCDDRAKLIRVVTVEDRLLSVWKLDFPPQAVCGTGSGGVFVSGAGILAKISADGKIQRRISLTTLGIPGKTITGLTRSGRDLFLACRVRLTYSVYRVPDDLSGAKEILQGLRGCCGQLDIAASRRRLLVGENTRHQVGVYDRDGRLQKRWGSASRSDPAGFGGCCNPMNLCVTPDGSVYTSEATLGRIKRYDLNGRLRQVIGKASIPSGCRRVTVRVGPKRRRVYVLDNQNQRVHVLEPIDD